MLFNSIEFLLFFPLVVLLYFALPHKWRWLLLLAGSYYFYMCWKLEYVFLIMASTLIDYYTGLKMSKLKKKKARKPYLYLSIFVNLAILFGFKYFNFFNDSVHFVFSQFNIFYNVKEFNVLLPVGISFYTFQTLSYSIDIYRGTGKAEPHLGIFAVYVSFFPQLVAGPIERSTNLLPQFHKKNEFSYELMTSGLKLMLWGFFKKVVIADRIGIFVQNIYKDPLSHDGITIYLASFLFLIQIYCDFSGYSDIAIGSARTMGYKLMKNFDRPFISRNISDFWSRWHISLNTWFRDYVLFALPFGKNKKRIKFRLNLNMVITVLLVGLWHGASWTYVLWGASIAVIMIYDNATKKIRSSFYQNIGFNKVPTLKRSFDIITLFGILGVSAIFFRAQHASDLPVLFNQLFVAPPSLSSFVNYLFTHQIVLILSLVIFLFVFEMLHEKHNVAKLILKFPTLVRMTIYTAIIVLTLILGIFTKEEFFYFQF